MRSFSAQVKMAKTRRAGRRGKREKKVVTRRRGRVQRGGQAGASPQAIIAQIKQLLNKLPTTANARGGVPDVAEAAEAVDNAAAEPLVSTPPAAEAPAAPPAQTGGKTKKSGKKRKLNGFMKFANTRRAALMKANPGAKIGEIGKMMGAEWRKMSDAAKQAFA
jgi:hypothetical protein